jgi:outer membrane autotransporter protein
VTSLWHTFSGTDRTIFNDVLAFPTSFGSSRVEVGAGVTATLQPGVDLTARGGYITSFNGNYSEAIEASLGLRFTF